MTDPRLSPLKRAASRFMAVTGISHMWFRRHERRESRNAGEVPATDEAGMPLPGAFLMYQVVSNSDWRYFLDSGARTAAFLADCAERNGVSFDAAGTILDLGCGCGRVARHLGKHTGAAIFGSDYNRRLVDWCRKNLPGTYSVNRLRPPIGYADGQFGLVYLLSVFTHLKPDTQMLWLRELHRITRPGGLVLVSIHDEDHPGLALIGAGRDEVVEAGVLVHNQFSEGSNFVATFQSREYALGQVEGLFELLEYVPHDANPTIQSFLVLKRREDGNG